MNGSIHIGTVVHQQHNGVRLPAGETIGRIPVLYSKYELEVILRTIDSTSSPARNWTDPGTYVSHEPTTAYMYTSAFLTMPRSTLLYAWAYDHSGIYKLLQGVRVNVLVGAQGNLSRKRTQEPMGLCTASARFIVDRAEGMPTERVGHEVRARYPLGVRSS